MRYWKVGALARQTGLTVRTLHHYDEIGLLSPAHRSAAGHRRYTVEDIARLQQIRSLRQLGFSLEEIQACLDGADFSPLHIVELHLAQLREQIAVQEKLRERLGLIAENLRASEAISGDTLIQTIEGITMSEKYFTATQRAELEARGRAMGAEALQKAEEDWKTLIDEVRAEMAKGTDPASEPVQSLARRWRDLVQGFTGGDAGIEQSLGAMYQDDPAKASRNMVDREVMAYISRASAALAEASQDPS